MLTQPRSIDSLTPFLQENLDSPFFQKFQLNPLKVRVVYVGVIVIVIVIGVGVVLVLVYTVSYVGDII